MIPVVPPLPGPVVYSAYLVGFYRSDRPGEYRDAGVYSEATPTFTLGMGYHDECDRSAVVFQVNSRRDYGRASAALEHMIETRPDLAWVRSMHTYRMQRRARITSATVLVARNVT